jgi:hypothetical protein
MIKKNLILVTMVIVLGCSQEKKNEPSTTSTVQTAQDEQVAAYTALLEVANAIDTSTHQLKENLPDGLKNKQAILDGLKDKKFCSCYPHSTGQAHFHPQIQLSMAKDNITPMIGLLKRFEKSETPGGGYVDKPCYLFFINNTLKKLTACQHLSDEEGRDAFETVCVNDVQFAYNLRPVDPAPHEHGKEPDDCH